MTREEAIEIIECGDISNRWGKDGEEVEKMVIKALEQEPILDKIRAEIENTAYDWQEIDGEHESRMVVDLNDALKIIDKYKAESEVQDADSD